MAQILVLLTSETEAMAVEEILQGDFDVTLFVMKESILTYTVQKKTRKLCVISSKACGLWYNKQ